jgi:hypothetical protein
MRYGVRRTWSKTDEAHPHNTLNAWWHGDPIPAKPGNKPMEGWNLDEGGWKPEPPITPPFNTIEEANEFLGSITTRSSHFCYYIYPAELPMGVILE